MSQTDALLDEVSRLRAWLELIYGGFRNGHPQDLAHQALNGEETT